GVRGGERFSARVRARSVFRAARLAALVPGNGPALGGSRRNSPMAATMGRQADALAFFQELAAAPYRYDFYQTLRRLECLHDPRTRWGRALGPVDEPVRLVQDPELAFAPAPLATFGTTGGRTPRLQVRLFGLFGPN